MYERIQNRLAAWVALTCLATFGTGTASADGLREMSTDRPDATESPFTVDAGHVQVELDLANVTRDRQDGVRTVAWEGAPFNLRLGLTKSFELGVFLVPYRRVQETPAVGPKVSVAGAGDLTLRGKWNFFGNEGGGTAVGLIADLKLPTAARVIGNGAVEGDLILPVSFELAGGWEVGAMTGVDLRLRDSGRGRQGVWINSVAAGHGLTKRLGGYLEVASETGAGSQVCTFDAGVTFQVDDSTEWDVGTEIGLSRRADDVRIFTGMARRF